jgi:hypothetical protein
MFNPNDSGMNLSDALKVLNGVKQKRRATALATVTVSLLVLVASLLLLGASVVLGALSVYGLYHLGAWIL